MQNLFLFNMCSSMHVYVDRACRQQRSWRYGDFCGSWCTRLSISLCTTPKLYRHRFQPVSSGDFALLPDVWRWPADERRTHERSNSLRESGQL